MVEHYKIVVVTFRCDILRIGGILNWESHDNLWLAVLSFHHKPWTCSLVTFHNMGLSISRLLSGLFGKKEMRMSITFLSYESLTVSSIRYSDGILFPFYSMGALF